MYICIKCKNEMSCVKNGQAAVWGKDHAYMGDRFKCKECGIETLNCNTSSTILPAEKLLDKDIEAIAMDEMTEDEIKRRKALLRSNQSHNLLKRKIK